MVTKRYQPRRRNLSVECLEKRQLMAAYINEIMIDPLFESGDNSQYIELRGEPNATLAAGTYFVTVSDEDRISTRPGSITGIFNLSGQQFGSNGFLVLLPQNSVFSLDPTLVVGGSAPNVLQSTETGFGNIGNDIYSDIFPISETIDFIIGSNTYFLLQSDVAPALNDDIDVDDDGIIDPNGSASTWNVLDSISLHRWVRGTDIAYGQIVFYEVNSGTNTIPTAAPGVEVISSPGFGYAARIGDSTEHSARDWVSGTVRDESTGTEPSRFRYDSGFFGVPEPRVFMGRDLDHLGYSNFIGGVRGTITETVVDANGAVTSLPIPGLTFLADTNGNGRRDLMSFDAEPNRFADSTELTNVFPEITLSTARSDNSPIGFEILSEDEFFRGFNGNRVFSSSGISFFNDSGRLRIDFYRPARSVSIQAIAGSTFTPTYGRLEAFNAAGVSLGFVRSRALFGTSSERIRLAFNGDVIAYAVAYSDDNFLNSSPFGRFDSIQYTQTEAIAITDQNGKFALDRLHPDEYNIVALNDTGVTFTDPLTSVPVAITRYENFDLSKSFVRNTSPVIGAATLSINENPFAGDLVGRITATELDPNQLVSWSLANADVSPLVIDAGSGELTVKNASAFDFELNRTIPVIVVATDSVGGASKRTFDISIQDVNEAPIVTFGRLLVSEEADENSVIGRIEGLDPESPNSIVNYEILSGSGKDFFEIGPTTGLIRVTNVDRLSFEQAASLTLRVAVSDLSSPPLTTFADVTVAISDANDRPMITSTSFSVDETQATGRIVGRVAFIDEDANQSHSFRILSGDGNRFRIDSRTGDIILTGALDFETQTSFELNVQIVDNGTPPRASSSTIVINILDVNEPATLLQTRFSIAENILPGGEIGTLGAIDPEGIASPTFRSTNITKPNELFGGLVILDPATGKLTVAPNAVFDADTVQTVLTDRVSIRSGNSEAGQVAVELNITNINEAPQIETSRVGYPKALPTGRAFANIVVNDPENDQVTLTVIGSQENRFFIDANKRLMALPTASLDFDATPEIEILVRAVDDKGLVSSRTITITQTELPRFGSTVPNPVFLTGSDASFLLPTAFRSFSVLSVTLFGPSSQLPQGLRFDSQIRRFSGIPIPSTKGVYPFSIQVLQLDGDGPVLKEETFEVTIDRPAVPLLNRVDSFDVDGNGKVEPIDALRVINFLAQTGGGDAIRLADRASGFFDTNGNNSVTPLDALLIINEMSRRNRRRTGESEWSSVSIAASDEKANIFDNAITEWAAESKLF